MATIRAHIPNLLRKGKRKKVSSEKKRKKKR